MYGIARERARDDAEDAMEAESRAIERRATAFLLDDVDLGDAWRDDGDDGEDEDDEENRGARERGRGRSNRRGGRTMTEEEERSGTVMGERVGRREVGEFQDARVRFRLLCPTARIGRVIGKEGKVIKATRAESTIDKSAPPRSRVHRSRSNLVHSHRSPRNSRPSASSPSSSSSRRLPKSYRKS